MNDTLSADLKLRLLAQIQAEPSPTRRDVAAQTFTLGLASVAVAVAMFGLAGAFDRWPAELPVGVALGGVAGWVVAAVGATLATLHAGRRRGTDSRERLVGVASLTPLLLFAWMRLWSGSAALAWPAPVALECLALGVVVGVLPLLTLLQARRGTDPEHPGLTGAALGICAGAWAGLLVALWCPLPVATQVLVGEILPMVALSALGAVLGRRVLGVHYEV